MEVYLKIARLFLEDQNHVSAEAYINRAALLQGEVKNKDLHTLYKVHALSSVDQWLHTLYKVHALSSVDQWLHTLYMVHALSSVDQWLQQDRLLCMICGE